MEQFINEHGLLVLVGVCALMLIVLNVTHNIYRLRKKNEQRMQDEIDYLRSQLEKK